MDLARKMDRRSIIATLVGTENRHVAEEDAASFAETYLLRVADDLHTIAAALEHAGEDQIARSVGTLSDRALLASELVGEIAKEQKGAA